MTKTKKITALLVVVAMLFTFVAAIAACQTTDTYALSYDLGAHAATGAKAPATKEYEEGQTVKLAAAPEAASGWQFDGWKDDVKTYAAGADFRMPAKAVKFTAQWKSTGSETHTCQHVCTVCHKCQSTCTESECAQKCEVTCTGNPNYNGGTTHTCNDVCTVCNKCQSSCTEPECAQKCEVTCPGNPEYSAGPNYGSESAPLSVTEALAIAQAECTSDNTFTAEEVYATGKVKSIGPTKSSAYLSEVVITDLANPSTEILIYTLNVNPGVDTPVQNDTIVVRGYIKNHQGTIEYSSKDGTYVYTLKNTRGTSTITLVNDGNATVTGLPATATNGSEVSFTVAAPAGKDIGQVLLGEKQLTKGDDEHYKFNVAGNATITVEVVDQGTHVAQVVYTLTTSTKGSNSAYDKNGDVEVDGITWNIEGNAQMDPWRFGGKSITGQDRKLTSKTALQHNVTKIVVKFAAATATVNSITLNVFNSNPTAENFAGSPIFTETLTFTANGTVTVEKSDATDWTGCYYQLVFNVTCGGSNQYVSISSMEFYA